MYGYCYYAFDCGCKVRHKNSAVLVHQDAHMDKCLFYTHRFFLIISQIQSFLFFCQYRQFEKVYNPIECHFSLSDKKLKVIIWYFHEKELFLQKQSEDTKMRRSLLAFFFIMFSSLSGWAGKVNLDSLYRILDTAIDSAAIYKQQKLNHISVIEKQYAAARNDQERYQFAQSLYREYIAFINDSALHYIQVCMARAERMGRKDLQMQSELALAYQLADTGFYSEAEIHLKAISQEPLTDDLKITYLTGLNHLYGEMGYYSHDQKLREAFFTKSDAIRDSLLQMLPKDSYSYNSLKSIELNNQRKTAEALKYSDQWMKLVQPGTREYATMSFYRSEIYRNQGDLEMERYWLIMSALTDIRQAIMDQAALWSLANSLMDEEGNLDRAYKYMDFSWECISYFSTHMRSWLVSPILTRINDKYKESLHQANTNLIWTIAAISLLVVGLVLLLLYVSRKRRQLALIRNELSARNNDLSEANQLLSDINEQLRQAIIHLNDSNRVKDEYIAKFLSLCSNYIDKLDNYRIKINRKLKAGQQSDVLRMTSSDQLKEDELKELFDHFDTIFLRLFPTFVEDFNALLKPGEAIIPPEKHHLNTDLRIFALIRLGIEESSKIAEFLRYSPNSIYAYRARIKSKAVGNREEFEKQVKEIGIKG